MSTIIEVLACYEVFPLRYGAYEDLEIMNKDFKLIYPDATPEFGAEGFQYSEDNLRWTAIDGKFLLVDVLCSVEVSQFGEFTVGIEELTTSKKRVDTLLESVDSILRTGEFHVNVRAQGGDLE